MNRRLINEKNLIFNPLDDIEPFFLSLFRPFSFFNSHRSVEDYQDESFSIALRCLHGYAEYFSGILEHFDRIVSIQDGVVHSILSNDLIVVSYRQFDVQQI